MYSFYFRTMTTDFNIPKRLDLSRPMRTREGTRVVFSTRKKNPNDPEPVLVLLDGATWPTPMTNEGVVLTEDAEGNLVPVPDDPRCVFNLAGRPAADPSVHLH